MIIKILLGIALTWMYNVSCEETDDAAFFASQDSAEYKSNGNICVPLYWVCKLMHWVLIGMLWCVALNIPMPSFTTNIPMFGVILGMVSMISYHCY